MDFKELVQRRRSHRAFTGDEISADDVTLLLRAALMSPTSKGQRAWRFIVVDDKTKIEKLSDVKDMGSQFMKEAPLVILVLGNPSENDCWIEDGSIAAYSIMLQAEDLGLGSCWVQMRARGLSDGTSANEAIRGIVDVPDCYSVLCAIAVGHKSKERQPQNEERLKWENVSL